MEKIFFITGSYLSNPEATGICIHKLAKEFVNRKYDVRTICLGNKRNLVTVDGVIVDEIKSPLFLGSKNKTFLGILSSRVHKLIHIFDYPLRSSNLRRQYVKEVIKNVNQNDDIKIVASFTPFEAVSSLNYLTKKLKCNSKKLYYYSADTLSNEKGDGALLSPEYRTKKGLEQEKKIFDVCDKVLIMECHKEHYLSDEFSEYRNKIEIVNFPLIDEELYSKDYSNNKQKQIAFVGTLYRYLRNPSVVCDYFLALQDFDYKLTFVGGGDCDDILKEKSSLSNGKIEALGKMPYEFAKNIVKSADILLSIGNNESPMMPSKIYEYVSTGKPIIHFYTWDNDPCISVLEKYKNALLIDARSKEMNINSLKDFITTSKLLSFEDIREIYLTSTPKYTVDIVEKE